MHVGVMAETTTEETSMTRTEAARFLRSIADGLDSGDPRVRVPVGNKEVQLSPPETVNVETTVIERSRRLRKDVEELILAFDWSPTRDTAEADAESGPDVGTDTGSDR